MIADDIKNAAQGRWLGILRSLGIPKDWLNGKHQPCPFCGGEDRFRFTDFEGKGMFFCNQCGSGSGFDLAMKYLGASFSEVAKQIEEILGTKQLPIDNNGQDLGKAAHMAEKIWHDAEIIQDKENPVCGYLMRRGLSAAPKSLRYHPRIFDGDSKKEWPAMVASIQDAKGEMAGIHLTFLERIDGRWEKARMDAPKKQRKIGRSISGCSIRLAAQSGGDGCLAVAEGIETAIAVKEMYGTPCWSAMNATGLAGFLLPDPKPIQLHIYADNDPHYAGQRAAFNLANRLCMKDDFHSVFVEVPPILGDYLDLLNGHATRRSEQFK